MKVRKMVRMVLTSVLAVLIAGAFVKTATPFTPTAAHAAVPAVDCTTGWTVVGRGYDPNSGIEVVHIETAINSSCQKVIRVAGDCNFSTTGGQSCGVRLYGPGSGAGFVQANCSCWVYSTPIVTQCGGSYYGDYHLNLTTYDVYTSHWQYC